MTSEKWSASNEILEACQLAIEERTNGRLSNLSVELVDETIVVEARSETYHAVQLALAAIHVFAAQYPEVTPATLVASINGKPLVLRTSRVNHMTSPPTDCERTPNAHSSKCPHNATTLATRRQRHRRSLALSP